MKKPMPTQKSRARKMPERMPAMVMFATPDNMRFAFVKDAAFFDDAPNLPVAVIPCPTRKAAREMIAVAKFFQMTEEERVEIVSKEICKTTPEWNNWRAYAPEARAVLARILKGGQP